MTQSPEPGQTPTPHRRHPIRRFLFNPITFTLGAITVAGVAGGVWWGRMFIYERLVPLVEENLSQTLKRPVNLGELERFTLNGLRLGASEIPATSTDPDRVTLEAVEVEFSLVRLLLTRTLHLNLTVIEPEAYLEQNAKGEWIPPVVQEEEEAGPIRTEIESLVLRGADVTLMPYPEPGKKRVPVRAVNLNGVVRFFDRNERITFDATGQTATGGKLELVGESLQTQNLVKLEVRFQNQLASEVDRLVKLPIDLPTGRLEGTLGVALNLREKQELPELNGTARFKDVTLVVPGVPLPLTNAQGGVQLRGSVVQLDNTTGRYGKVPFTAKGSLDLEDELNITARVNPTPLAAVTDTLNLTLPVPASGQVVADLKLTGTPQKAVLSGTGRLVGRSRVDRIDLRTASAQFSLNAANNTLTLSSIQATPVVGGQVTGSGQVKLGDRGGVVIDAQAVGIPGDAIARLYSGGNDLPFTVGPVAAQAQVFGPLDSIQTVVSWQAPSGTYPARGEVAITGGDIFLRDTLVNVGGGTITAQGNLSNNRWQAVVGASQIPLQQFSPDLRGQLSTVQPIVATGSADSFSPRNIRATGRVRLSQGVAVVTQPLNAAIRWNGDQLQIEEAVTDGFAAGAPGIRAAGTVGVQLEGEGAPAIGGLNLAVQTRDLDLATVPIALPNNLQLAGQADFVGQITGTLDTLRIAGTQGQNSVFLTNFALNGTEFESPLRGNLVYQLGQGLDLALRGRNDQIALVLDANNQPIAFTLQRGQAIARGRQQGNDLVIEEARNLPLSFLTALSGAGAAIPTVEGELNAENLRVNLAQQTLEGRVVINNPLIDPLSRILPPNANLYSIPLLGTIRGDRFVGDVRYRNGVFTLSQGELQQGVRRNGELVVTSRFCINAEVIPGSDPKLDASLALVGAQPCPDPGETPPYATGARLQDVLKTLQVADLDLSQPNTILQALIPPETDIDLDALEPNPVNFSNLPLDQQLRRIAEIQALQQQQRQEQEAALLPPLRTLTGTLGGKLEISGSLGSGIALESAFQGQNWQWGTGANAYRFNQVNFTIGEGSNFANGALTLLPLSLQFDEALVRLSGQIGGEQQSAQLRLDNVPIETIERLIPADLLAAVPIDIQGKLTNTIVTLSGTTQAPQAIGEINIVDATLNRETVQSAQGSFLFTEDRLDFGSQILIQGSQPVSIRGNVPVPLPFTIAEPDNDIRLSLDVKNEGLTVLNLFTPQVSWVGGNGEVRLNIGGTLTSPVATGFVELNNATLSVLALSSEPEERRLTGITGRATFEGGLIRVDGIQGQYRQRGQVFAQGVLPLSGGLGEGDSPLSVNLRDIPLNLRGLYEGGVDGDVQITGTALDPVIGGVVRLSNGQVLLADAATAGVSGGSGAGGGSGEAEEGFQIELDDLRLVLDDRIQVTLQPILNFVASGTLVVNGTLDELRPDGVIELRSGQVNLFSTQFVLERGYPQQAIFEPGQGLDPTLDVRLIASVPEVTRSRLPTDTLSSEVLDAPTTAADLGAVQTVRIQARVSGRASQLGDNLELTSSPARSEEEIISLLGGGFIATLGRGTDSTLGLANLAGSALLTNIQGAIGNVLGVSEFRLFPTIIPSDEARGESTLGLAAEVGVDITRSLSVSVLRVLTTNQPTQFGLRYRVNDNIRVRSFTDFSDNNGVVVEYETRF